MGSALIEVVDIQNEIIKTQSEVIDYLFLWLARYMTDKEMGELPIVPKIAGVERMLEELRGKKI